MQEILSRDTLNAQDRSEIERILKKEKSDRTQDETAVLKARFAYLIASERKTVDEEIVEKQKKKK